MSISTRCNACQSSFKVKSEYAGKRMKCPKCQAPVSIPKAEETPAAAEILHDGPRQETGVSEDYDSLPKRSQLKDRSTTTSPPSREKSVETKSSVVVEPGNPKQKSRVEWPGSRRLSRDEQLQLLSQLDEGIEPIRTTFMYRIAIAIVAAVMVLLPVIYISLIGLVGYGVYWHLVNDVGMLQTKARGKALILLGLAFAAPAIAGIVLIGFMLKPLFARRSRGGFHPQTVRREDEPFLFEFVERLCDAVGAPRPKTIMLDDRVNAAAALTSSVWNPFRNELMLVIGLPLVAGMPLRSFAGVLAHEFGHFSQGSGMRLGRIINQINRWFAFVVFERDVWDERLKALSETSEIQYGWVIYLTRGGVWLTRKILHGLMLFGQAMSCRLSREMEFDADRHEARLVGSDSFSESSRQFPILGGAQNWAYNDLQQAYKEGRLVENFFQLIMHRAGEIPEDARRELIDERLTGKTGWFDTHPCDSDRMASAEREATEGILKTDLPATVLFADFDATCRIETQKLYEYQLGEEASKVKLVSLTDLLARQQAEKDEDEVINRVLHNMCHYYWTLPFPRDIAPLDCSPSEALARIKTLRTRVPELNEPYLTELRRLVYHHVLRQESNLAERLIWLGMGIDETVFSEPMTNLDQLTGVREKIDAEITSAQEALAPILDVFAERIVLSIRMLAVPQVASRLKDSESLLDEARHLLASANAIQPNRTGFILVLNHSKLLSAIFNQLNGRENHDGLNSGLLKASHNGVTLLNEVIPPLRTIPYPFDHAQQGISVGDFLLEEIPSGHDPFGMERCLIHVANEGFTISWRTIARLCLIAERVEDVLGLPRGQGEISADSTSDTENSATKQ